MKIFLVLMALATAPIVVAGRNKVRSKQSSEDRAKRREAHAANAAAPEVQPEVDVKELRAAAPDIQDAVPPVDVDVHSDADEADDKEENQDQLADRADNPEARDKAQKEQAAQDNPPAADAAPQPEPAKSRMAKAREAVNNFRNNHPYAFASLVGGISGSIVGWIIGKVVGAKLDSRNVQKKADLEAQVPENGPVQFKKAQ